MFLLFLGLLALIYFGWSMVMMEINYRRASAMGIPVVRLCIDSQNLLWMILEPHVWPLLDKLSFTFGSFGRYSRRGWFFLDRGDSDRRYGPIWALATPREITVIVAESEAIHNIFQRRMDFVRPSIMYKVLEVYGPCISTANGPDWARHRKIVAAPFNEGIMSYTWDESVEQACQMLDVWAGEESSEISSVPRDTRTVSLNVLAATGFRKSYPFRNAHDQSGPANYRDSLQTILDNAILLMVAPRNILCLPFAPKGWKRLGKAAKDFKNHMVTMLNDETKALNEGKPGSGSLMTTLVRAMDIENKSPKSEMSGASSKGLSIDEIFGNIFVINFAGHDTTANTLSFAILLLSAYPEVQDWVAEELQSIPENTKGHYSDIFPKLNRCRAIMLETLRLFPPVPSLPKLTYGSPQSLKVKDKTIVIPQNSGLLINLINTHISSNYWVDPFSWKPARWITTSSASESDAALLLETGRILTPKLGSTAPADERIVTPARCTYFPWADGGHSCPGNKFSQVEFVAVMAKVLRYHRVRAIPKPGETCGQTRGRILATTQDVDLQLLLRMRDADQVRLSCVRV
ncbi:cytochrome P450 [Penicillium lagena]|uniref:cytochrome P450 n=1 Tax=Penicillium lagena TaxID=94218 RepID=UPI0025406F61|nr:cytochrome P450 [Penicillium lagena]KAJ5612403.1 cytochrome P450 [Penicillium lagena]